MARGKTNVSEISAHDWLGDEGVTEQDSVTIAKAFMVAGADIVNVSTGQTSHQAKPQPGRMFQTPLSDLIRNEGRVPTIAVGNIYESITLTASLLQVEPTWCAWRDRI